MLFNVAYWLQQGLYAWCITSNTYFRYEIIRNLKCFHKEQYKRICCGRLDIKFGQTYAENKQCRVYTFAVSSELLSVHGLQDAEYIS